jgi:serine/threonine-protein kinase RsbW
MSGRICHYLNAVLRDVAEESRGRRAALEALELAVEADDAVPIEAVIERMSEFSADARTVLNRLHARELLEISYGFVTPSSDSVLADYVRSVYRHEIAGARRPVAGETLLGEKLKHSYRLMMSRYNRAIEAQLVGALSRFDFQSIPASLLDQSAFDARYRGASRLHTRRALEEEQERTRLPQIVYVNNVGAGEQAGMTWRLFTACGFDGGIYSDANEVMWLIALINSKEPVDVETLDRLDHRLESAARAAESRLPALRWYISKEGFTAGASEKLASCAAHRSTFLQLDLLHDHLMKLAAEETERKPASEFELVIPVEDEAELIAARTVEQIARSADFDQEAINQIKTSLIEACINAAEHADSPDRRIYQRFLVEEDRLTITVSNKGDVTGWMDRGDEASAPAGRGMRGRGIQIIRALMDEVRFERSDDGTVLVMTKYAKRRENI